MGLPKTVMESEKKPEADPEAAAEASSEAAPKTGRRRGPGDRGRGEAYTDLPRFAEGGGSWLSALLAAVRKVLGR